MNPQYLYLFLLCIKFNLVSFDEVAHCLDYFPIIRFWHARWDLISPSSLSSNMITVHDLHRKVKIKEMICYKKTDIQFS
jgi:hypothetical protein